MQPRFLILDDGWQGTNVDDKMNGQQWGGRLTSFYANFKSVLSFVILCIILYYAVYIVIHYYTILCYLIDYYHVYVCHNMDMFFVSTLCYHTNLLYYAILFTGFTKSTSIHWNRSQV